MSEVKLDLFEMICVFIAGQVDVSECCAWDA